MECNGLEERFSKVKAKTVLLFLPTQILSLSLGVSNNFLTIKVLRGFD